VERMQKQKEKYIIRFGIEIFKMMEKEAKAFV
jgi:hypothetical protein